MESLDRFSSASLSMERSLSSALVTQASITASRSCSLTAALESMTEIITIAKQLTATLDAIPDVEQLQDWSYAALAAKASGVHELIIHQALMQPQAAAVVDAATGRQHTYEQLQRSAVAVADALSSRVAPASVVAVALPRSFELIASLLGAMLAGCTWVYLDPSYPDAHRKVVIQDSSACLIISDSSSSSSSDSATDIPVLAVEDLLAAASTAAAAPGGLAPLPNPDSCFTHGESSSQLMAILYTSGSTGRPKGVCLEHGSVLASMVLEPWQGVCQADVFAQCSSAGFPGSLHDLWLPLVRGATVVTIPREVLLEPAVFAATVAQHGITSAFLTPRVLELYADSAPATLDGLKRVWVAGEAVRPDAMALLAARPTGATLWNLYGCTEHCGCISGYKVTPDSAAALSGAERCPIGAPTSGVTVVLLDADQQVILETGVQGEIWIAGPQLSRGYHNLSGVTSERFVELPHLAASGSSRFYRTGDLGMWRVAPGAAAGEQVLDHCGRAQGVDSMVKVNGYQVQLSAVEAAAVAAAAGALTAAAASLYAGSKLALYYVPAPGSSITPRQLRSAMAAMVPSYMLPAYFTAISAIPLNAHGKIDRASLPVPVTASSQPAAAGEAISDTTEAAVAAAMEQVLGLASGSVRAEDSFVFDLGANSLSLFVLLPELRKLACDIDVSDVAVPGDDTPRLLAARIKQLNSEAAAAAAAGGSAQLLDLQQPLPAELVVVSRGPAGTAPVFIVHGGAGNSPVGLEMAQALRGKRTLIAITLTEGAAAAADAHPVNVVLGLAAHYADAIQKVQPSGPYTLSGVGRGSLIAYEVGRELEARQQTVTAVAALDYVFRPGTVNSSSAAAAASGKDFLSVASHMTVVKRLLAGGRAEGLSEEAAEQVVAALEQTLAADDSRAARAAAIKSFIATAVAPAIADAALRAFNTLGRAMNYDPLSGRGPAAALLQAPVVIARAADQEFMDGIFRQGNAPGVSARDLGWHQASAAGPATVIDVPGSHMDMLLSTESATAMAAVFETL